MLRGRTDDGAPSPKRAFGSNLDQLHGSVACVTRNALGRLVKRHQQRLLRMALSETVAPLSAQHWLQEGP